jgi:aminopeptidase N
MNLNRISFVLTLLAVCSTCVPARGTGTHEGRAPMQSFDILHIKLELTFDEQTKTVLGRETISLVPFSDNFRKVELGAAEMKIESVRELKGQALRFNALQEKLSIDLDKSYTVRDTVTLSIDYEVHQPQKGLYFVGPDKDEPDKSRQIWSQNWAEDAHYWFPCFDFPSEKSTFEVLASVPKEQAVISNGRLVEVSEDETRGLKTYHWVQDKPIHPAIQAIAVGNFTVGRDTVDGLPVEWYVDPRRAKDAPRSFSNTPRMIQFFSSKIGYPYPWAKHANVALADFTLYGAMENASCVFLADNVLHDERAHLDVSNDGTVAHELAHQWWGDVVSNRDWSELWLSEGFATYFSSLWTEYHKGEDEFRYELWNQANAYIREDSTRSRRPIVFTRYGSADSMLNANSYSGGSCRLHMLRFVLGDDLFWKVMNTFIRKYEFRSIGTAELEKTVNEVTGKNFSWFFDEWLYHAGYPEFEIRTDWDPMKKVVRLTVRQTQRPDSLTTLFKMPVDVEIISKDGRSLHHIEIEAEEQEFSFPSEAEPITVAFDRGNWIVKRTRFPRTKQDYLYRLENCEDVVDRIEAARGLAEEYRSDGEFVVSSLAKSLLHDPFWGVRVEAARLLDGLKSDAAREALVRAYGDPSSRVRRVVVEALGNQESPKAEKLLESAAQSDSSYLVVAAALNSLSKNQSASSMKIFLASLGQDSYLDTVRTSALRALGSTKDTSVIPYLEQYASPGNPPRVRIAAINALENFPSQAVLLFLMRLENEAGKVTVKNAIRRAVEQLQLSNTLSR